MSDLTYDPARDPFLTDAPPSRLLDDVDPAWGLPLGHDDHPNTVEYRRLVEANPAALAGIATCDRLAEHEVRVVTDLAKAYAFGEGTTGTDVDAVELVNANDLGDRGDARYLRLTCGQPLAHDEECDGTVIVAVDDLRPATADELGWLRKHGTAVER